MVPGTHDLPRYLSGGFRYPFLVDTRVTFDTSLGKMFVESTSQGIRELQSPKCRDELTACRGLAIPETPQP